MVLKAYHVVDKNNPEEGIFILSENINTAKSMALLCDQYIISADYIDLRVKVCKNADLIGLNEGQYDDYLDALKRGFCTVLVQWDCPACKKQDVFVYYDKIIGFYCNNCKK